jgi:hypothetical protein
MGWLSFAGSPHGGDHWPLPEGNSQAPINPTTILDHTQVGSTVGTFAFFRDSTGVESHFSIRGRRSGSHDGQIIQFMNTSRRADANLNANAFAISIETEDNGFDPIEPWSRAQIDSLRWLHDKLVAVHPGIKRREANDCDGPGLGYHAKLGAPSCWTPARGKTCPGAARISQWRSVLLPAFLNPDQEVDDMYDADAEKRLKEWIEGRLDIHEGNTNAKVEALKAEVAEIQAVLFNGHAIDPTRPIDNLFQNTTKTREQVDRLIMQLVSEPPQP